MSLLLRQACRSFLPLVLLGATPQAVPGQGYRLWFNRLGALPNSFAIAGDLNRDGTADIIVSGSNVLVLSGVDGSLLWVGSRPVGVSAFGKVAGPGDLDGDGTPDVLAASARGAFVFSGATGQILGNPAPPAASMSYCGGPRGHSIAATGDVDRDGTPDFAVGYPLADVSGLTSAGEVRIYSGRTMGVLRAISGAASRDFLGASLASTDDLDADGVRELLVGASQGGVSAPPFNFPPGGPGYVLVLSGASARVLFRLQGEVTGDQLGSSVGDAGDVDADGLSDLAVGADPFSFINCNGYRSRRAYLRIVSGRQGTELLSLTGYDSGWGLGDVDGDNRSDLLVGGAFYLGAWIPPDLSNTREAAVFSSTGRKLLTLSNPFSVGTDPLLAVGDVDGDRFPEVATYYCEPPCTGATAGVALLSLVGIPTGSSKVGRGCAGTGGAAPEISTFGGPPSVTVGNESFGFSLTKARGGAIALLLLGTASNPTGVSLGGCPLYLAGGVFEWRPHVSVGASGFRWAGLPWPVNPSWVGTPLHWQWAVLDPASPNGVFTLSDALSLVLQ